MDAVTNPSNPLMSTIAGIIDAPTLTNRVQPEKMLDERMYGKLYQEDMGNPNANNVLDFSKRCSQYIQNLYLQNLQKSTEIIDNTQYMKNLRCHVMAYVCAELYQQSSGEVHIQQIDKIF